MWCAYGDWGKLSILAQYMNIERYISDGQDARTVERLLLKLHDMLETKGEEVIYVAVQKLPAVTLFPDGIALTSRRLFFCRSAKLGLATDFEIIQLDAVTDLIFKEGILGATLSVRQADGRLSEMTHLPKQQVRRLYQLGREARAALTAGASEKTTEPFLGEPAGDPITEKLEKLKILFERQLITQAEYEQKKNELLSQL